MEYNKELCIIVVTHKDYKMPKEDIYLPVGVGPKKHMLTSVKVTDDNGNNTLASENEYYCELTALRWAEENLKANYIGMVHYRRYFGNRYDKKNVLTEKNALKILKKQKIILPPKRRYISSVKKHYVNTLGSKKEQLALQLTLLSSVIKNETPKYWNAFNKVMNSHSAHMLNMFIMSHEDFEAYTEWLFSILFSLDIKLKENNVKFKRCMGALSEFLLDTWIITNKKKYEELPLIETEKNTLKKIKWVLKRKLFE